MPAVPDIADLVPLPLAVMIQTNSACNLACRFCFFGQYEGYDTGEVIEMGVIEKILTDLRARAWRGRVSLYNINDPLTDPRIFDLVALARRILPDCRHVLMTNGLLLDADKLAQLLPHVDQLWVNKYGRLPDLDYSSRKIKIVDRRGFYQIAKGNRAGHLRNLPGVSAVMPTSACHNPLGQLVIDPPGVVILCCADGFKQVVAGDVRAENVLDIWTQSPQLNAVRCAHAVGRRHVLPLCSTCSIDGGSFIGYKQARTRFDGIVARIAARVGMP